jgi:predicted O-linked N-acetylglucosamine transferase (SPINDLY family)
MPAPTIHPEILRAFELARSGEFAKAEPLALAAVRRFPNNPDALYVLGCIQRDLGKLEPAIYSLSRARSLRPNDFETVYALAIALEMAGRFNESAAAYLDAQPLVTDRNHAYTRYADLFFSTGQPEEAFDAASRNAEVNPHVLITHVTKAAFSCYTSRLSAHDRFRLHCEAAAAFQAAPPPPARPLSTDHDPDRPLRIGYLSPDFLTHSVPQFFEPILDHVDQSEFAAYCYFGFAKPDVTTERLRSKSRVFRSFERPTEADIVNALQNDQIDIAIDLAGFSAATLVWALRQRVVPVQATYLGYPHSTGFSTIDYRLVDSFTDPAPAADALSTEKLIRLDPCFLCFRVPPELPPVSPLPSLSGAPFTFGSFNILSKISQRTRRLWARVLDAVPNSRLLLKDKMLTSKAAREHILRTLSADGIPADRVELLARTPTRTEHLNLYSRIDLCLDPTPYCGTTTTCEAAALGLPTVTLTGVGHVERVGASINSALDLNDLTAHTEDEYVSIAQKLAADRARLSALRASMRDRLIRSPLTDGPAFAARFQRALRAMWRERCQMLRTAQTSP